MLSLYLRGRAQRQSRRGLRPRQRNICRICIQASASPRSACKVLLSVKLPSRTGQAEQERLAHTPLMHSSGRGNTTFRVPVESPPTNFSATITNLGQTRYPGQSPRETCISDVTLLLETEPNSELDTSCRLGGHRLSESRRREDCVDTCYICLIEEIGAPSVKGESVWMIFIL
jgi:hypothetical protein